MTQWQDISTAPKDGTDLLLKYDESAIGGPVRIIGWYFSSPKQIDDGWETDIGSIGTPIAWTPYPIPQHHEDEMSDATKTFRPCATCGGDLRINEPVSGLIATIKDNQGEHHFACWGKPKRMTDRTAQTEPLTTGQRIVAKWESLDSGWSEPADLAKGIDDAIAADRSAALEEAAKKADAAVLEAEDAMSDGLGATLLERVAAAIRELKTNDRREQERRV